MRKTIFYNTNPVAISTRLNEYMKSNFGYSVDSDLKSLREAKIALEAQKRDMRADHQDRAYVENMLMLETIKSLLKAHVAEGELPPGLKAYQDKKKGKNKGPLDAGKVEDKVDEEKERCRYCGGDCPNDEDHACDGYSGDIDGLYEGYKIRDKQRGYGVADATYKTRKAAEEAAIMKAASNGGDWEVIEEKVATEGKYKSDAQRKAVHASKAEKTNEGDAPKFDTMKKYSNTYEAPKEVKMKKKSKLEESLMDQLNALLEADAADAEITMAARGIVDELQDMIEKLGKIQNDQLGPLADEMAYSHGPEQSAAFKQATDSAIAGLLGQARSTKDSVNDAVLVLMGDKPADDMAATGAELGGDMGMDFEDDISADMETDLTGGDESMSGPDAEPLGRAKR
ncbi:hypothetical protein N9R43_01610 [bacterium]|nr:hypothetical protein [bacterium]